MSYFVVNVCKKNISLVMEVIYKAVGLRIVNFSCERVALFNGPKIEYTQKCKSSYWQCEYLFKLISMPASFRCGICDADDYCKTPYSLHRAYFGSLRKFIGMLYRKLFLLHAFHGYL